MWGDDSQIDDARESLLGKVADEYFQAIERGERPSLSGYAARYPEIAGEIRTVFPALALIGDSVGDWGAAATATAKAIHDDAPKELGEYRLIREIGRGGMGVVYEAEQVSLGRRVALKVLPFAAMLDERQLQRFKNEARAAAMLHHPHIVPVHAIGCERGVHFYVMQLIDGPSLAEVIAALRRRELDRLTACRTTRGGEGTTEDLQPAKSDVGDDPRVLSTQAISTYGIVSHQARDERVGHGSAAGGDAGAFATLSTLPDFEGGDYFRAVARLGIEAAEALEHAHQHGIVHRDVKPGNLLLDNAGKLWMTDLGLAHMETDVELTRTGDVLGTLCYMSPEQALGQGVVDQRTDVYSLGATLYELATLRPAFPSPDRKELLHKIAFQDPAKPRQINRRLPADLETIICKAIEREAADRYPTARKLADDLGRFVAHQPIHARAAGSFERLAKWSRRHVGVVWTLLAAAVLMGVLLAVSTVLIARSRSGMRTALEAAATNEQRLSESLYAADIRLAAQAWQEKDPLRAVQLLDRHVPTAGERDYRDLEWNFLRSRFNAPHQELLDTGSPIYDFALSPSERLLAVVGKDGVLRVHEWPSMERVARIDAGQGELNGVAFSADEATIATVGDNGELRLWRNFRETPHLAIEAHDGIAYGIVHAAMLKCWITCGEDGRIRLFSEETGACTGELKGHTGGVNAIALTHDGTRLASASHDHSVRLWNIDTMKQLGDVADRGQGRTARLAFDPQDEALLLGRVSSQSGNSLVMVHLGEGRTTPLPLATHRVEGLAMSPDRQIVAAASDGGVILTLALDSGDLASDPKLARTWQACEGSLHKIAFTGDGSRLLTAGSDGRLQAWSELGSRGISTWHRSLADVGWVDRIGNKPLVAVAGRAGVGVVDVRTGELVDKLAAGEFKFVDASANGDMVVSGMSPNTICIWVLDKGKWRLKSTHESKIHLSRFQLSPDNAVLAISSTLPEIGVSLLDLETGAMRTGLIDGGCARFEWSPDGSYFAAAESGGSNVVVVVDARNGQMLWRGDRHQTTIGALAVSPNGKLIASADNNRTIVLWDAKSGAEVWRTISTAATTTHGLQSYPSAMQFTPAGRTLLVADISGHLAAWHVATGRELLRVNDGYADCHSLTTCCDGRYICLAKGGELRVIDAALSDAILP